MATDYLAAANTPVQLGQGIVQMFQANGLKKAADAAAPPLVDPSQASFLSELNQKRASLDAGSAYAAGLNNIKSTNSGTNEGLVQAGAGNTGGTIQALLQSQRVSQDSANQLNAQGQQEQNFNNSMYGELLNKVAARKMQLQLQKSQQLRAEWASAQQASNQNIGAAMSGGGSAPQTSQPNTGNAATQAAKDSGEETGGTSPGWEGNKGVSSTDTGTGEQTEGAAGGSTSATGAADASEAGEIGEAAEVLA